jgi:hypothetical protein
MDGQLVSLTRETSPSRVREEHAGWIRTWLACVALYYPILWVSFSLHEALPALVRILFLHQQLGWFRIFPLGLVARSVPADGLPDPRFGQRYDRFELEIAIFLVLAAILVLARAGRNQRTLSGLFIASLSGFGLFPPLADVFFTRRVSLQGAVSFVIFFPTLCLGLRWMLNGWVRSNYSVRVGSLFAGFVALPLVVWGVLRLLTPFRFGTLPLLLMAPGALAAMLVSFWPASGEWHSWERGRPARQWETTKSGQDARAPRPTWKAVTIGLPLTLLLAFTSGAAGRHLNQAFARATSARGRAAMAAYPEIPASLPYPKLFFQRGVNYTAEGPYNYDSGGARRMLEALPQYGINAIALMPYGWSARGKPEVHLQGEGGWESDEGMTQLARVAHARGIKVMLKPAIWEAYNLEFPSSQDRTRWFGQYRTFLEHYARLAKQIHADLLCIGGEFVHLTPYDVEWRKLIARGRELYPGPLVYAANHGSEFETITFWDALDYIGLQEYYSLPDDLATDELVQKVEAVQRKFGKPVIFTEVGFPSLEGANHEPWDDNSRTAVSLRAQASCTEAILRAFYTKPWFQGLYWWRVETNGSGGPADASHSIWNKPALDVIKRWYTQGGR